MARLNQEQGPAGRLDGPQLTLAAFGKHPGWDDHLPGIGVQTEELAFAKQVLYVSGIGGQIDAGAWEKLEPAKRLAGFDHSFLWTRTNTLLAGKFWSSTDGRGRGKYPMVVCVEGAGMSAAAVLAVAGPELEKLKASCQQAQTAEGVTEACRHSQGALNRPSSPASASEAVQIPIEVRRSFLSHKDLGPERLGLLRVLHEIESGVGTPGAETTDSKMRSSHLRVPLCAETGAEGQLLWLEFLRCLLPANISILLIARAGVGWLDVLLGEPGSGELFCLQASPKALPLATEIPYEIEPHLKTRLEQIEATFLADKPPPKAGPRPAPVSASRTSQPRQVVSASGAEKSAMGKWLILGAAAIIVVVIVLAVMLREGGDHTSTPKPPEPSPQKTIASPQTTSKATAPLSNADQAIQKEEVDFQKALQEARTALKDENPELTIQMAERALVLKPNSPDAAQLKADAKAQLADVDRLAAIQQNYEASIAAGRQSLDAGQFETAVGYADEALRLRPEDPAALQLKSDAEVEMANAATAAENERRYQAAMAAGREALGNKDWQAALDQAKVALSLRGNDPAATKLKADSESQLAKLAAMAAKERLYQTAMADGQGALGKGQWQTALDQANVALAQKPGDAAATQLRADAQAGVSEASDLVQARAQFAKGKYAEVLDLCSRHPSVDAFLELRAQSDKEQGVLNDAHKKFAAGNYTFIDEIEVESYAAKPPFQELLMAAEREKGRLAALQTLQEQGNWSEVLDQLATLGNEAIVKPPFARLKGWAQPYADKERDGAKLEGLDTNLQKLLVWFNILKPSDAQVTSKEAREAKPLPPKSLSLDEREKYLTYVRKLEAEYRAGGWLGQNGRQEHLTELEERIPSW